MVPLNKNAFCGTQPTSERSICWGMVRMSCPCRRITPSLTSCRRSSRSATVLFPEPVPPMMAVVSPGGRRSSDRKTGDSAPG